MILKKQLLNYALFLSAFFLSNTFSAQGVLKLLPGSSKVGYFYPDTKDYHFLDRVRYKNDNLRMETDTLRFNYATKKSFFFGKTYITKDSIDIESNFGWYHTRNNKGYLHGNAMLKDPRKILYADTIFYNDSLQKIEAKQNVHFSEIEKKLRIQSNYLLKNESTDETFVSDCVIAEMIQGEDTIYIHSDTLEILPDSLDGNKKIFACSA